jgi:hypothetical protein
MRYKASGLGNVEFSAGLFVYNTLGYLPHSTSDLAALGHLLPGRRDYAFGAVNNNLSDQF